MSFEWSAFLELARTLASQHPTDEAALRSAASRAYYAAFHHARLYIETKDPTVSLARHGIVHEQVPDYLEAAGRTRTEKGAAEKLERLKRLRTWADYQRLAKPRLRDDVEQALRNADSVLGSLVASS